MSSSYCKPIISWIGSLLSFTKYYVSCEKCNLINDDSCGRIQSLSDSLDQPWGLDIRREDWYLGLIMVLSHCLGQKHRLLLWKSERLFLLGVVPRTYNLKAFFVRVFQHLLPWQKIQSVSLWNYWNGLEFISVWRVLHTYHSLKQTKCIVEILLVWSIKRYLANEILHHEFITRLMFQCIDHFWVLLQVIYVW